ncbi:hypothetical protein CH063_00547 [Colletotrichum higginsianum]|uniref:Uncharacterized protein n=1 Tax=Colletotrichum higginsianum (strain IMI 349063) TaxID=759273 RepID=H1VYE1_COLHI|nr:hypothetical protein CH063_00547 [Colletotrichum higginsianum]
MFAPGCDGGGQQKCGDKEEGRLIAAPTLETQGWESPGRVSVHLKASTSSAELELKNKMSKRPEGVT